MGKLTGITCSSGSLNQMRMVRSMREVEDAVNQARNGAKEYCTNFFPNASKLEGWVGHGEMFCDEHEGTIFFLRRDSNFWHLFYCAASQPALQQNLASLPLLATDPVVMDVVGKKAELAGLTSLLKRSGFRHYQSLFRMTRLTAAAIPPTKMTPNTEIAIAGQRDCQPIHDLLVRTFDSRAEQIPPLYEIEAAVAAARIRVIRNAEKLAGLLFFETQGVSSLLRYWLVDPGFRAQGVGSALMRCYLAEQPSVRRFLLWVVASNSEAIKKYEHYGFNPDGLVDYVMANDKIRP